MTLVVLVTSKTMGRVGDILDFDYSKKLLDQGYHIRFNKKPDDILDQTHMTTAGCMCMQIWVTRNTHKEVAKEEMEIRKNIFKIEQEGNEYPDSWLELAGN